MLTVVGIGPGNKGAMTEDALHTLSECSLIVGYTSYTELVKPYFADKEIYSTGMRSETERVRYALAQSADRDVALICSGDSAVYAMAGLVYEIAEKEYPDACISIKAGITAALSGGALLGAPLTNDFAVISLSDLLTPADVIERRLRAAAGCDIVTVIYNPSSHKRKDHLKQACGIFLEYRPSDTVCGITRNIGRDGEEYSILTLEALEGYQADMFTTVFIGNSYTRVINGKMVTVRGYEI
ncbi:MAG: precorrin-3B C(17)-methyltransferase [Oscillospiraceae bacterium]|nr:precorrin-3B C(17)-methyltransferase [Oscillospiraceae bacterium]